MALQQSTIRNCLLRALSPEDFALVANHLSPVTVKSHQTLISEDQVIQYVYFPETALCSIVAPREHGELIEVGMFGFEGCSDMVLAPGYDRSMLRTIVQGGGEAFAIPAKDYADAIKSSTSLLQLLLRYNQVMITQMAYTSLSHGSLKLAARLARWLLMCQDRVGDELTVVHDWIALMLSTRRAGVTQAIHVLEGDGSIRASRGHIVINDRNKLMALAGRSYGPAEAEYERVIGEFRQPKAA